MANVTIYEFDALPDQNGDLAWPGFIEPTTIDTSATHTLNNATQYVVVTADADCRIGFNKPAVPSGMNVLTAAPNPFKLRNGTSRTLKFA